MRAVSSCTPPCGYLPRLELSLRERCEGGELAPAVRATERRESARREAVILVHGFNNDWREAAKAYVGFRHGRSSPSGDDRDDMLADLFWPGDAEFGIFDSFDAVVYPAALHTARAAGPRLAAFLRANPAWLRVHFVGHSLGCRVVLEAIDDLRRDGGPVVGKVCLMAAAVPVEHVRHGGPLAAALGHAEHALVLYSRSDGVLFGAFPAGQTSGGDGFLPVALGREGLGQGDGPGDVKSIAIPGAGHGDYWGHAEGPAARAARRLVAGFLAPELRAAGASRSPGVKRGGAAARAIGSGDRALNARIVADMGGMRARG
jgi:hypothetical protein